MDLLKLCEFTEESFKASSEAWIKYAKKFEIPTLDYERIIEWAKNRIRYSDTTSSLAYGIFSGADDRALAIVDIVYTKRPGRDVGWIKMLDISLSPSFASSRVDADALKLIRVIDIFSVAISGTIDLTGNHTARVMKMYGRDEHLLSLLVAVNERLQTSLAKICDSRMDGRWLVISLR